MKLPPFPWNPTVLAKHLVKSILLRRCLARKQGPRCSQVRQSSPLLRSCQESNRNLTQFQTSISAVWGLAVLVLSTRLCGQRGTQLWESFPSENELPRENFPNNNDLNSHLCLLATDGLQAETWERLPVSKPPNIIWYFVIALIYAHMYVATSVSQREWASAGWRVFKMSVAAYSETDCFHWSKQHCVMPVVTSPRGQIMNRLAGCAVFSTAVHTSYSHFIKVPSGNLSVNWHLTATLVSLFCEHALCWDSLPRALPCFALSHKAGLCAASAT